MVKTILENEILVNNILQLTFILVLFMMGAIPYMIYTFMNN